MTEHLGGRPTELNRDAVLAQRTATATRLGASSSGWPEPWLAERAGSTNEDLLRAAQDGAAHLQALSTLDQRAGRGRLDRVWEAPPGTSLSTSILLRAGETVPTPALGWASLLVAIAAARAIEGLARGVPGLRGRLSIKWPNDLLLDRAKVAGSLARLLPPDPGAMPGQGGAVVVGLGLNLHQGREELPVGTATSLALGGVDLDADAVLGALLAEVCVLGDQWLDAAGSPSAPLPALGGLSLLAQAREKSATLGAQVRVMLPGGRDLVGEATDLDSDGCLVVRTATGEIEHVHAGDVVHLRGADGSYAP